MTDIPAAGRGPHFVQSVARAFSVLRAFDATHPVLTLGETARKTGLDGATARRLLLTLADLGYVRADDRSYRLTPRTLELGFAYLSTLVLPETAQPHLQALAHALGETATLSVLDGEDVFHLAVFPGFHRPAPPVGARSDAWTTACGLVLLATLPHDDLERRLQARPEHADLRDELEHVRARGWALKDGAVAAPVRNRQGKAVAAVGVSVRAELTPSIATHEDVPELLRAVHATETAWALHGE